MAEARAPEPKQLNEAQVARTIAERDRIGFALFLGAGASKSSGVLLASEMIAEWREMAYADACSSNKSLGKFGCEAWCKQQKAWYEQDDEYSQLFELIYEDSRSRQRYIEDKIKDAFPSWGYLYLANIVQHGRFNIVFTTNFDDLINEALTIFLGYNAVVCAVDSEVATINVTTDRAKIVKLHGDYLFESFMKNTSKELKALTTNMEEKFAQFALENGLVVLGYAGRDESIMRVLEQLLKDGRCFPHGLYWGLRVGEKIAPRVRKLALDHPERFRLFTFADFDSFMARLHDLCGGRTGTKAIPLELPETILTPYQALEERYQHLLKAAGPDAPETIRKHVAKLQEELSRPWAKAKADDFDLLQAQISLGRRDYKAALQVIENFVAKHPRNADGLTAWGNALAIRAEEESSASATEEAVAKWKEAIAADPNTLQARYSLARHYAMKQQSAEGIAICEDLRKLVPNDLGLRRNLAQFYGNAGRYDESERELQWLLEREPNNAELHAFRASLLEQRGLIPEAIEELKRCVTLAPQNAWMRFGLGNGLAKTNRVREAATEFEEAICLDPRNINFRIQVAQFYLMQNHAQLALPHLQTAVQIAPQSAEAHGWLCQTMLALGNFPAAQIEGEAAVRLSPNDTRLRMTVGMAYQQAGRVTEAEAHYVAATQINPAAPEGCGALAQLYFMQNRSAELNAVMQRLQQINPQVAQMLHSQMQVQQMQRMQQTGQSWLQNAQDQWRAFMQNITPTAPPQNPPGQPPPLPNQWHPPR